MTFTQMIAEKLAGLRQEAGLVEVKLKGATRDQLDFILANGGQVVRSGYETWCNSDTCAHNSHDAGEHWDVVAVPQAWVAEAADALNSEVWDLSEEDGNFPKFMIPGTPPLLMVQEEFRHSAGRCFLAELREAAAALVG